MRNVPTAIAILAALVLPAAFAKAGDGEPLDAVETAVEAKDFDRALELAKELGESDPPWDIGDNGLVRYSGRFQEDIRLKGRPYREIWEELSGMDYKAAMNEANAHCRNRVESALGQSIGEFVAIRGQHEKALNGGEAATAKWLQDGGRNRLEKWLTENAGHPAEPMARFCLARSLARAGEGEAARELLGHILENDGFRCTLLDDAQFWIGVSYNWEKDFDNAREAFGVLLRDFPVSHSAKQVAGKFPPAGPVTE